MYKRVFSICVIIVLWASSLWAQSADALLDELARTTSERSAERLVDQIWSTWTYPDTTTDQHSAMDLGVQAMRANALDQAENIFSKIIDQNPDYMEAWNKRATVRFMRGDVTGSEADIYQVLIREPRHFGAIAGLGMINMKLRDFAAALNAYERVKTINPFAIDAVSIIPDLKARLGIVDL